MTTASASSPDPLIGRVLDGRYRLVSPLADGGMGRIYLAEQQALDRTVAVKILRVDEEDTERADDFRARFFREAKLSSKLSHPNTVRVYDYGKTEDDIYYIVMEYIRGSTLTAILKLEGPLDPLRTIGLALQLCGSVAEAHALGVIHRDLKPDNLMITRQADGQEVLRVLDFGIARPVVDNDLPTQSGYLYGSPGYMSPEQILEHELTVRSDLYSMGAILFRALTGRRPFSKDKSTLLLAQHVLTEPPTFSDINPRLTLPENLEWVVRQCLKKDPAHRFASVSELAWALRVCALELRGLTPSAPMSLQDGRLVLPAELEAEVRRLDSGEPITGHSGRNKVSQILTVPTTPALAPRPRPRWGSISAIALCVALSLATFAYVIPWPAAPVEPEIAPTVTVPEPDVSEPEPVEVAPAPAPVEVAVVQPAPAPPPAPEPAVAPAPRPAPPRPAPPKPEPRPPELVPEPAPQASVSAPAPAPQSDPVGMAVLTFDSDPPGAVIQLNGVAIGRTPLRGQPVSYGVYELKLELAGQSIVRTVRIGARGSTSFRWQGDQLIAR